jgi:type I restriction enzyme R subunit
LNKKLPKRDQEKASVLDAIDLDSLRIQMIGESTLPLVEEIGEVYGITAEGGKGAAEEEKVLLSDIIKKVNELFGVNLGEEDRITLGQIQERLNNNEEIHKVLRGDNTDNVKREYFNKLFKDTVIDYHGDRIEFYKNVMNPSVYPMLMEFMYREVFKNLEL